MLFVEGVTNGQIKKVIKDGRKAFEFLKNTPHLS